jgi:hypothetical protein
MRPCEIPESMRVKIASLREYLDGIMKSAEFVVDEKGKRKTVP